MPEAAPSPPATASSALRVAWAYARSGYRRYAQYPLAAAAGAFTNTLFAVVSVSILGAAVTGAGGSLRGFDADSVEAYIWYGQGILSTIHVFHWAELVDRVRTGDVVVDLTRPVDLQAGMLATDLGRAWFAFVTRFAPPVVFGLGVYGTRPPGDLLDHALALVSLVLGVLVSFAWRYLLNTTAFWLTDVRGLLSFNVFLTTLLTGLSLPLQFLPDQLARACAFTPYPSMVNTPLRIALGQVAPADAPGALAGQLLWAVALLLLGRVTTHAGLRTVVVQGG